MIHTSIWKTISDGWVRKTARQRFAGRAWVPGFTQFWRLPLVPPSGWILKPPLCVSEEAVDAVGMRRVRELLPLAHRMAALPHLAENQGLGGKSINREE